MADTAFTLLRELRTEVRDWQDALCGERDGFDALCARIDEALDNPAVAATPAARWRAEGAEDPHGSRYNCERAALEMGAMTDDEMANAVFMEGDRRLSVDQLLSGALPGSAFTSAAKDRIRWLSRKLEEALAEIANSAVATPWERRGSAIYTEDPGEPGLAEFVAELHGIPGAVACAQMIVDRHNRDARLVEPAPQKPEPANRKTLGAILREAEAAIEQINSGRNGKRTGKLIAAAFGRIETAARSLLS